MSVVFSQDNKTLYEPVFKLSKASVKTGVLTSLNALSHYFFSFFKGSNRRLCKTPLYRRTV